MINNLNILLPEIFLTISIFSALMIGVFIKNSFNLIFNLSSIIILVTIAIILNNFFEKLRSKPKTHLKILKFQEGLNLLKQKV